MSDLWSIGEVMLFVDHPDRMIRINPHHPDNVPFVTVNRLGEILEKFSKEDQNMYVSNFIDTLEQALEAE